MHKIADWLFLAFYPERRPVRRVAFAIALAAAPVASADASRLVFFTSEGNVHWCHEAHADDRAYCGGTDDPWTDTDRFNCFDDKAIDTEFAFCHAGP